MNMNIRTTSTRIYKSVAGGMLAGLVATLPVAALAEEQPIQNSSFDATTNDNLPDGWKLIGGAEVKTEDQISFVQIKKEGVGNANYVEQTVMIPPTWKSVQLVARVRVSELGGPASGFWQVAMIFQDAEGKTIEPEFRVSTKQVTDGWESFETDPHPVPENAGSIMVRAGIWNGEGTFDVDSIALVKGGE